MAASKGSPSRQYWEAIVSAEQRLVLESGYPTVSRRQDSLRGWASPFYSMVAPCKRDLGIEIPSNTGDRIAKSILPPGNINHAGY